MLFQIPGSVSVPLPELREAWKDLDDAEFEKKYDHLVLFFAFL